MFRKLHLNSPTLGPSRTLPPSLSPAGSAHRNPSPARAHLPIPAQDTASGRLTRLISDSALVQRDTGRQTRPGPALSPGLTGSALAPLRGSLSEPQHLRLAAREREHRAERPGETVFPARPSAQCGAEPQPVTDRCRRDTDPSLSPQARLDQVYTGADLKHHLLTLRQLLPARAPLGHENEDALPETQLAWALFRPGTRLTLERSGHLPRKNPRAVALRGLCHRHHRAAMCKRPDPHRPARTAAWRPGPGGSGVSPCSRMKFVRGVKTGSPSAALPPRPPQPQPHRHAVWKRLRTRGLHLSPQAGGRSRTDPAETPGSPHTTPPPTGPDSPNFGRHGRYRVVPQMFPLGHGCAHPAGGAAPAAGRLMPGSGRPGGESCLAWSQRGLHPAPPSATAAAATATLRATPPRLPLRLLTPHLPPPPAQPSSPILISSKTQFAGPPGGSIISAQGGQAWPGPGLWNGIPGRRRGAGSREHSHTQPPPPADTVLWGAGSGTGAVLFAGTERTQEGQATGRGSAPEGGANIQAVAPESAAASARERSWERERDPSFPNTSGRSPARGGSRRALHPNVHCSRPRRELPPGLQAGPLGPQDASADPTTLGCERQNNPGPFPSAEQLYQKLKLAGFRATALNWDSRTAGSGLCLGDAVPMMKRKHTPPRGEDGQNSRPSPFHTGTQRSHTALIGCWVRLTNGSEVWSTELTPEMLAQHRQRFEMRTAADYISKIRSACEGHSASLLVRDSGITLELGAPGPGALTLSLTRLQDPEGQEEIRGLLFSMAERLREVESTAQSFSPVKTQQRCSSDFEPRRRHNGGGASAAVKKRLPGDSLINPGTKR
ncbi:PAXX protein, partial [Atractosteus spatula]|nr:PAXX protein [Atractosteus spatula]